MKSTKSALALSVVFGLLAQPSLGMAWELPSPEATLMTAGSSVALVGVFQLRTHNQKVAALLGKQTDQLRTAMNRDFYFQSYLETRESMDALRAELAKFKAKQAATRSVVQKKNLETKMEMIREELRTKNIQRRELGKKLVQRISTEERIMTSMDVARRYNMKEAELFDLTEQVSRKLKGGGVGTFLVLGGLAVAISGYIQSPTEQSTLNEAFAKLGPDDQDKLLNVIDSQVIDSDDALAELIK